jgi:PhnB protein
MTIRSVQAHFTVRGGQDALSFYEKAFGAEVLYRLINPADGSLGHAEMRIGDTVMMLNDEYTDFGAIAPDTLGGSPLQFVIMADDIEAAMAQAVAAGATLLRPISLQFHGHKAGVLMDPFGHRWSVLEKVEDVAPAEMQRRWDSGAAA